MRYYIETADELRVELGARREARESIARRVDEWAAAEYGIRHMLERTHRHLGIGPGKIGRPVAALCRQIASANTEDCACYVGARLLGLEPKTITFLDDSFSTENHDKRSRVKIPWISWSRKRGTLVLRYENIAGMPMGSLDRRTLRCITTPRGRTLQEHHFDLRLRVFPESAVTCPDVSYTHQSLLAGATTKPSFAYAIDERGEVRKLDYGTAVRTNLALRPPAAWYYPIYLSWFVTGDAIMLETYENEESGVPEARRLFEAAMKAVTDRIGWRPLIIRTPPLTMDMLYMNRHVIETPGAILKIERDAADKNPAQYPSLHDFFRDIAALVIGFRNHTCSPSS